MVSLLYTPWWILTPIGSAASTSDNFPIPGVGQKPFRPAKRRRAPGGPTAWLSHWQILQDDHTNPYPMGSFDDNTNPEKGSKVV